MPAPHVKKSSVTAVRGRQFSYSHTIGNAAIFCYPVHMSLDADNNLYVVNRGHDGDWVFGINKITVDEDEIGKFGGDGRNRRPLRLAHGYRCRQPGTRLRGRRVAQPHFRVRYHR